MNMIQIMILEIVSLLYQVLYKTNKINIYFNYKMKTYLPKDIVRIVYEYDDTYREILNKLLRTIPVYVSIFKVNMYKKMINDKNLTELKYDSIFIKNTSMFLSKHNKEHVFGDTGPVYDIFYSDSPSRESYYFSLKCSCNAKDILNSQYLKTYTPETYRLNYSDYSSGDPDYGLECRMSREKPKSWCCIM